MTPPLLFLLTAAWIATVPNAVTVLAFAHSRSAGSGLGLFAFALGGWLFMVLLVYSMLLAVGLLARDRVARTICVVAVVAASVLSYFTTYFGVQFDRTMFANIVQTNTVEAVELLSPRLLIWVVVAGVLPAIAVWRLPMDRGGRLRQAVVELAIALVLLALTGALVYAQYSRYASAARNREISFGTVAPLNFVAGTVHFAATEWAANVVRAPRGKDAHAAYAIPKARLLVLLLGETARAKNQGLNGYSRDTTPRMRAAGGFYFPDTEACGTATTISVPCIFSGLSRNEFSLVKGRESETLIDVVKRSGARVLWLDNDSGCKDTCTAAEYHDLTGSNDPRFCPEPADCHDDMLLDGLEDRIRADRRDTLVVLHLKGSHGPAYYRRYPPAFERFTPVCRSADLAGCEADAIVNAYDNSILYTDHIVGEVIEILRRQADRYATALLYVSDHGESLGEAGLFLHGLPNAVAPREQTRVPMYAWVSPQFVQLEGWNVACMRRQTAIARSHDNVYATVLGFMEVESVEYKPALDLFDPCDPPQRR